MNFGASFGTALLCPDLRRALPHPFVMVLHEVLLIQRRGSLPTSASKELPESQKLPVLDLQRSVSSGLPTCSYN